MPRSQRLKFYAYTKDTFLSFFGLHSRQTQYLEMLPERSGNKGYSQRAEIF